MKTASVTTMIALILSMMLGCSGAPPPTIAIDVARVVHDGCLLVVDLQASAAATEVCETEADLYPLVTAALAAASTDDPTQTATPGAETGGDAGAKIPLTVRPPEPGSIPASKSCEADPQFRASVAVSASSGSPALVIRPDGRSVYLLGSAKPTVALIRERRVDR